MEVPSSPQSSPTSDVVRRPNPDGSAQKELKEASIHGLPFELLNLVFRLSLKPKDKHSQSTDISLPKFNLTALSLSHTCTQWRSITLNMPELWAVIEINTPPSENIVQLLQLYLARSGDTISLDVSLSDSLTREPSPNKTKSKSNFRSSLEERDCMGRIFTLLIDQVHRWKKLDFYIHRNSPPFRFFTIPTTDLGNLESMSTDITSGLDALGRPGPCDTALRGLWHNIHKSPSLRMVRWQSLDPLSSAPFSQLTKIHLPSINVATLFETLGPYKRMQHIEIDRLQGLKGDPQDPLPTDPIQIPNLEIFIVHLITFEAADLLNLLVLPNLKELYLRHGCATKNTSALEGLLSRSLCSLERFSLIDRDSLEVDALSYLNQALPFFRKVKVCMLKLRGITERTVNTLFMPQYVPLLEFPPDGATPISTPGKGEVVLPFPCFENLSLIRCFVKEDGLIGRMVMARQFLKRPLFALEVEVKGSCIPWLVLKKDEWILNRLMEDNTEEWKMLGRLWRLKWRVQ
ncbi:hypothetical protein BDN72DRAFT_845545 [Pluteus cervinus]|uniref:Uncharacterized protein n=1 Tax=Pluteus cervinus TaxID=181527 RepID=A0ACD3AIL8_9AGAR|nr:hypothetical protein BDN72DRAFT_845545 [Pluteus cervinus]